jgi:hypothetical protein
VRGYLVPTDENTRTRVYKTQITGAGPAPSAEQGERGAHGPEHQDDRIELDRVAQATAVILRACGLSAELFDKVKRPELDGHIRLPRCAVRGRVPVRLSILLVSSVDRAACLS